MLCTLKKKQIVVLVGIVFFALIVLGIAAALFVHRKDFSEKHVTPTPVAAPRGGAVTNGEDCARIARDIIYKGGTVVDAGIATAICEGVAMAQSMGLGGGFFATIYIRSERKAYTLNAREVAPLAATPDMYFDNPEASKIGGLAVAVPGEIRGYAYLHNKFGKLPWADLFQPTIDLCRTGLYVNKYLEKLYRNKKELLQNTAGFSDFIDPKTGEPYRLGDRVTRPKLAETLMIIANEPDALHNGSLTKGFVEDVRNLGGIITVQDMNSYEPIWMDATSVPLSQNHTLHTFPPPGSGAILAHIMGLLSDSLDLSQVETITNWQRIIESFKFAYGMRTNLGDPLLVPEVQETADKLTSPAFIAKIRKQMRDDFTSQDPVYYGANTTNPEDHGTAHINVLAPNGDAFAFTGTINLIFGANIMSKTTGIILNNEMDDFASQQLNFFGLPSSPANFIAPGKRPLSSMCPSVIVNADGSVRMLVGGAGGTKITTASALTAMRHMWFGQAVGDAIALPRMHHQLFPMKVSYDPGFNATLIAGLQRIGHVMEPSSPDGFGAVTAVTNISGVIEMAWDPRRSGAFVHI